MFHILSHSQVMREFEKNSVLLFFFVARVPQDTEAVATGMGADSIW